MNLRAELNLQLHLNYQHLGLKAIRELFNKEGFLEVLSPSLVPHPGCEPHVHPLQAWSPLKKSLTSWFLPTSPEFFIKSLYGHGALTQDLFSLGPAFRDDPQSPIHRSSFTLLEWYRLERPYEALMRDCENILQRVSEVAQSLGIEKISASGSSKKSLTIKSISEVFTEILNFDPLHFLDENELRKKIRKDFPSVPLPSSECEWEDLYHLIFLNLIEPRLKEYPFLILKEFPTPLRAYASVHPTNPHCSLRFELFVDGIEVANAYQEETSAKENQRLMNEGVEKKTRIYQYQLPIPKNITPGDHPLPPMSGIAMGLERVFFALSTQPFCFTDQYY